MSLALIEQEVRRFLKSGDAGVLCIRGKWGVGKTFAWKRYVQAAASEKGQLALENYSYVSLFGLNTLDALRFAVFQNTVPRSELSQSPDLGTFEALLKRAKATGRGALPFLDLVFNRKGMSDAALGVAFLAVRKQLVCLDDLERSGAGLQIRDVLGVASFLKEERGCQVVLLLNDEKLSDVARAELNQQLEKVVDTTLTLDPSPSEAVAIALSDVASEGGVLRERVLQLRITNIRVIRRIARTAARVTELLSGADAATIDQAITAIALGVWSVQQPDLAPPLDFIRHYNAYSLALRKEAGQADETTEKWRSVLSEYPYNSTDELDAVVLDGVAAGYFDADRLKAAATLIEARRKKSGDEEFSRAWQDLYHGSLATPDAEFLDALYNASLDEAGAITPLNINSAIKILRQEGRTEQADKVVNSYLAAHRAEAPEFFDLSNHIVGRDESIDEGLAKGFAEERRNYVDPRDPIEVLRSMSERQGWEKSDVALLAKLSPEDFERLFETLRGRELRRSIELLQSITRGGYEGSEAIGRAVRDALTRIGKKSRLNAEKVARYGVTLDK